jgi:hypothetical protein
MMPGCSHVDGDNDEDEAVEIAVEPCGVALLSYCWCIVHASNRLMEHYLNTHPYIPKIDNHLGSLFTLACYCGMLVIRV